MNIKGHFETITRHKLLVMKYCFECGLYRQGLTHDLSKYSHTACRMYKLQYKMYFGIILHIKRRVLPHKADKHAVAPSRGNIPKHLRGVAGQSGQHQMPDDGAALQQTIFIKLRCTCLAHHFINSRNGELTVILRMRVQTCICLLYTSPSPRD